MYLPVTVLEFFSLIRRKLKSGDLLDERGGANQRPRRTEVGIRIFVPDYKRTT